MGNEKRLRLIQVAKEFKVGLNTITDFLQKKGIKSDGSPNTLVDADTYAVLEKEFGANRSAAGARDSVRERIAQKQTTVTIAAAKPKEEKEVVIKSNMIHVKDEIRQPKFLGKIDLSPKPAAPKPAPQPAAAAAPQTAARTEEKPAAKVAEPAPTPAAADTGYFPVFPKTTRPPFSGSQPQIQATPDCGKSSSAPKAGSRIISRTYS